MESDHIRRLAQEWREYRDRTLPHSIEGTGIDEDTHLSLYEQDGYLAGLTTSFLGIHPSPSTLAQAARDEDRIRALVRGARAPRPLARHAIHLDRRVDVALAQAIPTSDEGRILLQQWADYRQGMLRMAEALSRAANVPMTDL